MNPVSDKGAVRSRPARALDGYVRTVRSNPLLSSSVLLETLASMSGRHPVDESHAPHLEEAIAWLERAQGVNGDHGFARGYGLTWNPHFRSRGWQPSYPETTGYIIPTFLSAARILRRPELEAAALAAARWETEVQLHSGAVQGGVIGEGRSPAVFNTGQVIFGWLAAYRVSGRTEFAAAAHRAASYLRETLGPDGFWRRGSSKFANQKATLYNTRTAWALAEAGEALEEPAFTDAARASLRVAVSLQRENGWFPHCCLNDAERPLLHTLAYATRGLLEGGRVLGDESIHRAAVRAATALMGTVRADGWMSGRFDSAWGAAVPWSCLTGEAQFANILLRLHEITGERSWLEPVPAVLRFVKSTQNRTTRDPGLRGGIKGSEPVGGGYGRFEVLNWATKFYADALMRHDAVLHARPAELAVSPLA